MASIHNTLLR
jgi:HD-like signal output (HDOD) protein